MSPYRYWQEERMTGRMTNATWSPWSVNTIGVLAIIGTVGLGILLRLEDPLSTPVVPAEDPYAHMALVREHLRTGTLAPLTPNGNPYPAGMHSFVAAVWVYTGADLYEIVRIGPAFLGGIGILGAGLLLWRHEGPVAAFIGSLAFALAPEAIFRTTMMSPTALDLAILPFYLYALLEVLGGRIAWTWAAAPMTVFLVFAHPWLFGMLAVTGVVFCVAAFLVPWSSARGAPLSILGLSIVLAVVGGGLGLTLSTCGGQCGPGFRDVAPQLPALIWFAPIIMILAAIPVLFLALNRKRNGRAGVQSAKAPPSLWARIGFSATLAALILLTTLPALRNGMPENVSLIAMVGWPILALAIVGLLALPFVGSPLAYVGAAWCAATYPMVIYNLLNSPYWPHRTAVFLGLGLVVLAGVGAGALARLALLVGPTMARSVARTGSSRTRMALAAVPALLVAGSLAGTVYSETPETYPGGWYRLYRPCELAALRSVAAVGDAAPAALLVTGDWQSKLVLAAMTTDASRVWYKAELYTTSDHSQALRDGLAKDGRPLFVVVDRFLRAEHPDADTAFLNEPPWHLVGSWCAGMGLPQPRVFLYSVGEAQS